MGNPALPNFLSPLQILDACNACSAILWRKLQRRQLSFTADMFVCRIPSIHTPYMGGETEVNHSLATQQEVGASSIILNLLIRSALALTALSPRRIPRRERMRNLRPFWRPFTHQMHSELLEGSRQMLTK